MKRRTTQAKKAGDLKKFWAKVGNLMEIYDNEFLAGKHLLKLFKPHFCSRPLIHLARKTNRPREIHLLAKDRPTCRHSFRRPLTFPLARLQLHRPASHRQPTSHHYHQPASHQQPSSHHHPPLNHQIHWPASHRPRPNYNVLHCHQLYPVVHLLPTSHHQIRWVRQ